MLPDEGAPGLAGPPSVVQTPAGLAGALFPGISCGPDVTVVGWPERCRSVQAPSAASAARPEGGEDHGGSHTALAANAEPPAVLCTPAGTVPEDRGACA